MLLLNNNVRRLHILKRALCIVVKTENILRDHAEQNKLLNSRADSPAMSQHSRLTMTVLISNIISVKQRYQNTAKNAGVLLFCDDYRRRVRQENKEY